MPAPSSAFVVHRLRRVPCVFFVLGAVFVVLRLTVVLRMHQAFGDFPDSGTYRRADTGPVYSYVSFAGNAMRPFTVPLLYRVLPSDGARVTAQFLVSVTAWLTLAGVASSSFRDRRVRVAAFATVLLFGSTYLATTWDLAIASESLTVSLGVLCLAAWLRFAPAPTVTSAAAVVVTTTLWMFTRSQAFPLVAALAVVVALAARRPDARVRRLTVAGALILVAFWGFASVKNQEHFSAARNGNGVGIFGETFALNLRFRILPDPVAVQWFRGQGMPEPVGLEGRARTGLAEDDWAGWPAFFDAHRAHPTLTRWVDEHGQATFAAYTLRHPTELGRQFAADLPAVLAPDRASVAYVDSPVVLGPVDSLLTPYAGSGVPGFPTVWLLVACGAGALLPRRRPLAMPLVITSVVLLAVSLVGIFLGWLGSPVEFARHALPFTLLVPLGLVLLLLTILDAVVPNPSLSRDAHDGAAVEGSMAATGSAPRDRE